MKEIRGFRHFKLDKIIGFDTLAKGLRNLPETTGTVLKLGTKDKPDIVEYLYGDFGNHKDLTHLYFF